jgi:hypothetical protein
MLIAGISWSVMANISHGWADPLAAKAIAAWPPLSLAVSVEVVLRFIRRLRERAEGQAPKIEKPIAVKAVPPPRPAAEPQQAIASEPVVEPGVVDGLTEEMRTAGWAPSDYADLGKAMRGYLEKVNSEASGSDLWSLVGPHFGKSGKDTGMGRAVVRKFKEEQAAQPVTGE